VSAPVASSLPAATAQHTTSVQPHSFTMTEVKAHSSAASCYTVVHGVVYDVSSWIGKHPGGQGAIKGMCGVDATSSFDGQHGGSARPESELAQFKIGTLTR
jgi:cytochrome b involved in lipid metabolism